MLQLVPVDYLMDKTAVKHRIKCVAAAIAKRCLRSPRPRVVVLCYHSIHPSKTFASASPQLFDLHLSWLRRTCNVIPFGDIMRGTHAEAELPSVAVTFDDGYADNYEHAFGLLQKHGLTATFFVTAGLIEKHPAVVDRFQSLRQAPADDIRPLSWSQLREMAGAGMSIAAHTYSHPNLASVSRAVAAAEVRVSKHILEQRLGVPVTTMAYPFGKPNRHFTRETMDAVAEAGYESAAAVLWRGVREHDCRFAVPRILVSHDDLRTLAEKVSGGWDLVGVWQEKAPRWAAKLVSAEDYVPIPGRCAGLAECIDLQDADYGTSVSQ
jgi:peptidoglycan/xylan/chitin deacetylase (PgdA/CDA1 family)